MGNIILYGSHPMDNIRGGVVTPIGRQVTPASSKCAQLWMPMGLAGQLISIVSVPAQATLSRTIGPLPCPKNACDLEMAPA